MSDNESDIALDQYPLGFVSTQEISDTIDNAAKDPKYEFVLVRGREGLKLSEQQGAMLNTALLSMLLEKLLTNANQYLESSPPEEDLPPIEEASAEFIRSLPVYHVFITLGLEVGNMGSNIVIEVKDNCKPLPDQVDKAAFIESNHRSDQRDGMRPDGYDIDRIARYLGSDEWELIQDESQFPTTFVFRFPLVSI